MREMRDRWAREKKNWGRKKKEEKPKREREREKEWNILMREERECNKKKKN